MRIITLISDVSHDIVTLSWVKMGALYTVDYNITNLYT